MMVTDANRTLDHRYLPYKPMRNSCLSEHLACPWGTEKGLQHCYLPTCLSWWLPMPCSMAVQYYILALKGHFLLISWLLAKRSSFLDSGFSLGINPPSCLIHFLSRLFYVKINLLRWSSGHHFNIF